MKAVIYSQIGPISIDFTGLGQAIVNALITGLQALFAPLPREFEQWLLASIQGIIGSENNLNLLTQNPLSLTTGDSDVQSLFTQGATVEAGIAVLVLAIQAFRIMNGRVDMWEAIMRTAFFVIAGDAVLLWAGHILNIVNLAASAVATNTINIANQDLPTGLELAVILIIGAIFAMFTWIKGAVGIVFLRVLLASAPYLITLSALPLLDGLGKWWAEEFTTWTLRPFMVALCLRLGLGIASTEGGPLGLLFIMVTFWLAWTMDTRIRRFTMGTWGSVGQLNMFARGARLAAGAFSGGTATAAGAATAAAHP